MVTIIEDIDAPNLRGEDEPASPYRLTLGDTFVGRLDDTSPDEAFDTDYIELEVEPGFGYVLQLEPDGTGEGDFFGVDTGDAFLVSSLLLGGPFGTTILAGNRPSAVVTVPVDSDETTIFAEIVSFDYTGGYRATLTREEAEDRGTNLTVAPGGFVRGSLGIPNLDNVPERDFGRINDSDLVTAPLEAGVVYTFTVDLDKTPPSGARFLVAGGTRPIVRASADVEDGFAQFDFTPDVDAIYEISLFNEEVAAGDPTPVIDYVISVSGPEGRDFVDDDGDSTVSGTPVDDRLDGRGGADLVRGFDGADALLGGSGDDTLEGGAGADTLDGGPGADLMRGGAGDDVFVVDAAGDMIDDTGGLDEVVTAIDFAAPDGIERLTAAAEAGRLRLDGNAGDNVLTGNAANNILVGFGGTDAMTGGGGADFFVLVRAGDAPEIVVTDFTRGEDRLAVDDRLLGLGSGAIDRRDLTAEVFAEIRDAGLVGYDARTGELRIDADGDGARELVAILEGGAQLGLDDVILF